MKKNLLLSEMARMELTRENIAELLGITRQSLGNKMDGKTDFKLHELNKIRQVLGLTPETFDAIFFD